MNRLEQYFFDVANVELLTDEMAERARIKWEIARMWADYAREKAVEDRYNKIVCESLWADKHDEEIDNFYRSYIDAGREADIYFGDDLEGESYEERLIRENREQQERLTYYYPKTKAKRAARLEMAKTVKARNRKTLANTANNLYPSQVQNGNKRGCKRSEITQKDMCEKIQTSSKITRRNPDIQGKGGSYKKTRWTGETT